MSILNVSVIDGLGDTLFLVLHIGIVNSASVAKTIYQIHSQPLEGFHFSEVPGLPDLERNLVTFQPFTKANSIQVKLEDNYSMPLDIEPNHSKSVYIAIGIQPIDPSKYENTKKSVWKKVGYLVMLDHHKKPLSKVDVEMPFRD
jgi:hypothetical protein